MTTMQQPTGAMVLQSPSGVRERHLRVVPSWDEPSWASTPMDVRSATPALREVVAMFSGALDRRDADVPVSVVRDIDGQTYVLTGSPLSVASFSYIDASEDTESVDGTSDVLHAFDLARRELGLSQKEMFEATGIKKRTYHSWRTKPPGMRPRVASQGRFWSFVDAMEDLREILDRPLDRWIRGDRQRLRALLDGRFDDLVDLAVNRPAFPKRSIGNSVLPSTAAEIDVPIIRTGNRNVEDVEDGLGP